MYGISIGDLHMCIICIEKDPFCKVRIHLAPKTIATSELLGI